MIRAVLILIHVLGLANGDSRWYLFWSGSLVAIFAAFAGAWWHHLCHEDSCHRWGRYQVHVEGGVARLCKRHHGDITGHRLTTEVLKALHAAHLTRRCDHQ